MAIAAQTQQFIEMLGNAVQGASDPACQAGALADSIAAPPSQGMGEAKGREGNIARCSSTSMPARGYEMQHPNVAKFLDVNSAAAWVPFTVPLGANAPTPLAVAEWCEGGEPKRCSTSPREPRKWEHAAEARLIGAIRLSMARACAYDIVSTEGSGVFTTPGTDGTRLCL